MGRRLLALAALCLPMALAAQNGERDPFHGLPNVRIVYYDVAGTDVASINVSLRAKGPRRPDGRVARGMTEYDSRYAIEQSEVGSVCTIRRAKVMVYSTVHLPRLTDEERLPEVLLIKWRSFIRGLAVHEAGHVRIQNAHRSEIEEALSGAPCDAVKSRLATATARIAALQEAYDKRTRDGATQGAVL